MVMVMQSAGKANVTVKVWQFLTMMLLGLALAAGLAHAMELPPKMSYEARLYVELHRTLYRYYGLVAGIAEFLATIGLLGLAWRVRRWLGVFRPTAISAGLMVVAHLAFYAVVQPANGMISSWSLDQIPPDWVGWRDRWEYGHAVRALLITMAFGAFVISFLQSPEQRKERRG